MTAKIKVTPALKKRMDSVPLGWVPPNVTGQKQMFRKRFRTDLHGVILDWTAAFCNVAKERGYGNLDPSTIRHYAMGYDITFPVSPVEFWEIFGIVARLKGTDGYGGLPVRKGAVEAFQAIKAAGIPFDVCTFVPGATGHNPNTLKAWGTGVAESGTIEHLTKLGIIDNPMRQVIFQKPYDKAHDLVSDHIPLIIEDNPVTAVDVGYNFGHASILVNESYNEHLVSPGVLRIKDMSELAPAVIDFFAKLEDAGALAGF